MQRLYRLLPGAVSVFPASVGNAWVLPVEAQR